MKRIKFLVSLLISTLCLFGAFNVDAAGSITVRDDASGKYTVTREVNKVTNPVSNTFTYSITPDSNNPAGVTGAPTTFNITFNNTAPNASNIASATYNLDFKGTTFPKVGDYKFLVTEQSSSDTTNYPKSDESWTIGVSVRFKNDGTNDMTYTFVAPTKTGGSKEETKSLKFTKESTLTNISVTGEVSGNMADVDEYFKIKVIINGDTGDTYTITGQDSTVNYKGSTVTPSTTYRVGEDNYVYLKHGQTITIGNNGTNNQIKSGITYQFIEQDAEEYITSVNGSSTDSKDTGLRTTVPEGNNNTFLNKYERATLTGIMLTILPYLIIVVLALGGIIYMIMKSRKNDNK